jgi:hypothetical protein
MTKVAREFKTLEAKEKQPLEGNSLSTKCKCLAATSDSHGIHFCPLEKWFTVTDVLFHMKDRYSHWSVLLP